MEESEETSKDGQFTSDLITMEDLEDTSKDCQFTSPLHYLDSEEVNGFLDVEICSWSPDMIKIELADRISVNRLTLASVSACLKDVISDLDPNENLFILTDAPLEEIEEVVRFVETGTVCKMPNLATFEAFGIDLNSLTLHKTSNKFLNGNVMSNLAIDNIFPLKQEPDAQPTSYVEEEFIVAEDFGENDYDDEPKDISASDSDEEYIPEEFRPKRKPGRPARKKAKIEKPNEPRNYQIGDQKIVETFKHLDVDGGMQAELCVVSVTSEISGQVRQLRYETGKLRKKKVRRIPEPKDHVLPRKPSANKLVKNDYKTLIKYFCKFCDFKTRGYETYRKHEWRHNRPEEETHYCIYCLIGFTSRKDYDAHNKANHVRKKCFCEECGRKFKSTTQLNSHKRKQHTEKSKERFRCIQCGLMCGDTSGNYRGTYITTHLKEQGVHHSDKCAQCDARFKSYQEHMDHINAVHNGVYMYVCGYCPETFVKLSGYRAHKQRCPQAPKWVCHICGEEVKEKCRLQHMKEFHVRKEYPCDKCDRVCYTKKKLSQHYRTNHADVNCDFCGKFFNSFEGMKNHRVTHLPHSERPFQCEVCGSGFATNGKLQRHIQQLHPGFK